MHVRGISGLNFSAEVIEKLIELQNKGIDVNELILGFLEKREEDIKKEKTEIVENLETERASRHIPIEVRRIVQREYGTKCAVPNCLRDAKTLHHTARFALVKAHNPYFIAPLCREHHLIAHAIDLNFREKWRVVAEK